MFLILIGSVNKLRNHTLLSTDYTAHIMMDHNNPFLQIQKLKTFNVNFKWDF